MKYTPITILMIWALLSSRPVSAQDCGTWIKRDSTTSWTKVKDFAKAYSQDTVHVESAWEMVSGSKSSYRSTACPCECRDTYIEVQYRVVPKTGLQEKRLRTTYFEYVPKEKTLYEKIIDSLKK
jgi:hypothetical protein